MAVLDFPASPTVGQIASLTNGFSYQWDGAVWTLAASTGQAAGGALAGTYPNPTIAASAIRGTPSSGGTAREIQKASIWGGDDLIDLSIPTAKHADLSITKAKLGPDVSGLVASDLAILSLGANSSANLALFDFTTVTSLPNRRYRLTTEGYWNKPVAMDLFQIIWLQGSQMAVANVSPASITTEIVYWLLDFQYVVAGGTGYIRYNMTISNAIAGGATTTGFGRMALKTNSYTGLSGSGGPQGFIQFGVANASNNITRYQTMLEVL